MRSYLIDMFYHVIIVVIVKQTRCTIGYTYGKRAPSEVMYQLTFYDLLLDF